MEITRPREGVEDRVPPFKNALAEGGCVKRHRRASRSRILAQADRRADRVREGLRRGGLSSGSSSTARPASPIKKFLDAVATQRSRPRSAREQGDHRFDRRRQADVVCTRSPTSGCASAREESLIPARRRTSSGSRLPAASSGTSRGSAGRDAPSVHLAAARRPRAARDRSRAAGCARAYDVVLNGLELGGGSIRIHDTDAAVADVHALGIGEEEARPVRLPARRVPLRRAAARRDRARARPDGDADVARRSRSAT